MYRNHGRHRRFQFAMKSSASLAVKVALVLQIFLKFYGVHAAGTLFDIHEIGPCSGLRNGFRRSDKCVRHSDYDVTGLNSRGHQRKSNCVGAAGHPNAVIDVAELREFALKLLHHGRSEEHTSELQSPMYLV